MFFFIFIQRQEECDALNFNGLYFFLFTKEFFRAEQYLWIASIERGL